MTLFFPSRYFLRSSFFNALPVKERGIRSMKSTDIGTLNPASSFLQN